MDDGRQVSVTMRVSDWALDDGRQVSVTMRVSDWASDVHLSGAKKGTTSAFFESEFTQNSQARLRR